MYFYASVTEMYSLLQGLNPERLHKYAVGYACEELTVKICDKILQPLLVYSHVQSMQRFNAVVNSSCSLILSDVNPVGTRAIASVCMGFTSGRAYTMR